MDKVLSLIQLRIRSLSRDQLVALGIGAVIIVLGVLYFIFTSQEEAPDIAPGSIEQPIPFTEGKVIELDVEDESLFKDVKFEELPIYDLKTESHVKLVQDFLADVGKGFVSVKDYDGILYQWNDDQSQFLYMTEYNSTLDKVFFRFKEPTSPDKLNVSSVATDQMDEFFVTFARSYWNSDLEYTNVVVKPEGRAFRIEANRMINGVPVETSPFESYSDYLVVETDGRVSEGLFHIFEYEANSEVVVDLVDTITLGSVLSEDDYPKSFYPGLPIGFDIEDFGYEEYESDPGDSFYGDTYLVEELDDLENISNCKASKVSLIYLFVNVDSDKLTPVYRIDCTGEIVISGNSYDVPIVIYASAIDPEFVYIPGDIPN